MENREFCTSDMTMWGKKPQNSHLCSVPSNVAKMKSTEAQNSLIANLYLLCLLNNQLLGLGGACDQIDVLS